MHRPALLLAVLSCASFSGVQSSSFAADDASQAVQTVCNTWRNYGVIYDCGCIESEHKLALQNDSKTMLATLDKRKCLDTEQIAQFHVEDCKKANKVKEGYPSLKPIDCACYTESMVQKISELTVPLGAFGTSLVGLRAKTTTECLR